MVAYAIFGVEFPELGVLRAGLGSANADFAEAGRYTDYAWHPQREQHFLFQKPSHRCSEPDPVMSGTYWPLRETTNRPWI